MAEIIRLPEGRRVVITHSDDPLVQMLRFVRNTTVLIRLQTNEKHRGLTTAEIVNRFAMFRSGMTLQRYQPLLRYDPVPTHPTRSIISMRDVSMEWTTTPLGDDLIRRAEAGETEFMLPYLQPFQQPPCRT